MEGLGSGWSGPSGSLRSNCMKTRFQSSIQESLPSCSAWSRPKNLCACASISARDPPGSRQRWISLQGPQGPVGPMAQKLSFSPRRKMRSLRTPIDLHSSSASSSSRNTVTASRSAGSPSVLVTNSHAQAMASFLK